MNWRVIVAVVVALLVGAGAGAFGEHQRLKDDSNKKTTSTTTKKKTTTTKKGTTKAAPVADFFGSKTTQACPALKEWNTAAVASYTAVYQKVPWATTKVKLTSQLDAMTSAFVGMERYANATGKTALAAQLAYQAKSKTALAAAPSSAEYLKTTKVFNTAQVKQGGAALTASVKKCGTA
jgi:hypothetical protein